MATAIWCGRWLAYSSAHVGNSEPAVLLGLVIGSALAVICGILAVAQVAHSEDPGSESVGPVVAKLFYLVLLVAGSWVPALLGCNSVWERVVLARHVEHLRASLADSGQKSMTIEEVRLSWPGARHAELKQGSVLLLMTEGGALGGDHGLRVDFASAVEESFDGLVVSTKPSSLSGVYYVTTR